MEILNKILNYFISDPLRILYLIGGSGGLLTYWDRIKNRRRLYVEISSERSQIPDWKVVLQFEIENRGSSSTSLMPKGEIIGYSPKRGKRKFEYDLRAEDSPEQDRNLPPDTPKKFNALIKDWDGVYSFLLYRTYKFSPTKGRRVKVRLRYIGGKRMSRFRFYRELFEFRFLERIPKALQNQKAFPDN